MPTEINESELSFDHAIVIHPVLPGETKLRAPETRLQEAVGLALAIGLEIVEATIISITRPKPATLFGGGRVETIREALDAGNPRPGIVIVDAILTPVQHRNLEKEWDAKVLDRTALILEIFGERAATAEGRLQVELAHLTYQRSRLVRSWTHLERQRGGAGFLGGPGERQIESDRRALADKIVRLKKKLEDVRRTRTIQRARRKRAPHPVVALVGYTNAGKSTLFNRMTKSGVLAEDMLFATLDPTMRAVDLPSGIRVILSDTVGFISDLPTELIAAFRATLEEVLEAELVLHVRDIAHAETVAQREDVLGVLADLGLGSDDERPFIEVLNKIDLIAAEDRNDLGAHTGASREHAQATIAEPLKIAISAETGENVDELFEMISDLLTAENLVYEIEAPAGEGAAIAWLHQRGEILSEAPSGEGIVIQARLSEKIKGQFEKVFPALRVRMVSQPQRRRA